MAYWAPFSHDNKLIELSHLEPIDLEVKVPSGAARLVHVTFSAHTFTRQMEEIDPKDHECFDQRVFCADRHTLSENLAAIIKSWPNRRVYQTWEKRSWVYLATAELGSVGGPYHIFFSLKREVAPARVALVIESAYRKDPSTYTPPKRPNAVRFSLLVDKVFLGQPLHFK